ncbi:ribonuclease D [Corynebacterium phocae]|uniref:Ribonuclease D n=1 Tax=Corynebacterium phocae TaxID=161895 RepID=A0A1L7D2T7_9CORY|nr:HRDC domain-containing protein [Corynebacterium phocae]APT92405.1 ribonuclease D [Corynebacterium phocae]KAA8725000.1 ribonuclease D [Corynebacterium phocae]
MSSLHSSPSDGIPSVADSPSDFLQVAKQLAAGTGPFAIDTERASAFRYDDRAFLLQIRRNGAGTFLIDPEGGRAELSKALGPVLNGAKWVIHAAPSDLPCLAWLGLYPGTIFDTELAARIAGYDHPNLSAMTELLLGVELEKGYGDADWSARPIPRKQLAYAALDVEFLLELAEELAEILAEDDKTEWAEAEFAEIVRRHADVTEPQPANWRDLKGIYTLTSPAQLNVAKALWTRRDTLARAKDLAPGRLLSNRTLIEIARAVPTSEAGLRRVRGFPSRRRGASSMWIKVLEAASRTKKGEWPRLPKPSAGVPAKSSWSREYPELWSMYQTIRDDIEVLGEDLSMNSDTIIRTAELRAVLWAIHGDTSSRRPGDRAGSVAHPGKVKTQLIEEGAREWQADLVAPIIVRHAFPEN